MPIPRALHGPDNLDWADDGSIHIQAGEAARKPPDGEPLFCDGAANPNEAGGVKIHPETGSVERIYNIDRSVVIDPTTEGAPWDKDAGAAGEWGTSGILDVSELFGEEGGSFFLMDIQAHGIEDQEEVNPDSRLNDGDPVEGGQLAFVSAPKSGCRAGAQLPRSWRDPGLRRRPVGGGRDRAGRGR